MCTPHQPHPPPFTAPSCTMHVCVCVHDAQAVFGAWLRLPGLAMWSHTLFAAAVAVISLGPGLAAAAPSLCPSAPTTLGTVSYTTTDMSMFGVYAPNQCAGAGSR